MEIDITGYINATLVLIALVGGWRIINLLLTISKQLEEITESLKAKEHDHV